MQGMRDVVFLGHFVVSPSARRFSWGLGRPACCPGEGRVVFGLDRHFCGAHAACGQHGGAALRCVLFVENSLLGSMVFGAPRLVRSTICRQGTCAPSKRIPRPILQGQDRLYVRWRRVTLVFDV